MSDTFANKLEGLGRRDMERKLMSLQEAVLLIKDGNTVGIGGILNNRVPMAMVHEIIRAKLQGLSVIGLEQPLAFDMLAGAGCTRSIETAFLGFVTPDGFRHMRTLQRAVQNGEVDIRENIGNCFLLSLELGCQGAEFGALKSIRGTSIIVERPDYFKEIESPYTGEEVITVPAYHPDIAIIHAQRGDEFGNIQIRDPGPGVDEKLALCSKKTIVTVEEIVSHEAIRGCATLPNFIVSAVVKVPGGAHPTACYQFYRADYREIENYLRTTADPNGFGRYVDMYVFGVKDHSEYLERVGWHHEATTVKGGSR